MLNGERYGLLEPDHESSNADESNSTLLTTRALRPHHLKEMAIAMLTKSDNRYYVNFYGINILR